MGLFLFLPLYIIISCQLFWNAGKQKLTFDGPIFFFSSLTLTPLAARLEKLTINNKEWCIGKSCENTFKHWINEEKLPFAARFRTWGWIWSCTFCLDPNALTAVTNPLLLYGMWISLIYFNQVITLNKHTTTHLQPEWSSFSKGVSLTFTVAVKILIKTFCQE